ncbi:MAG: hypothetical protein LUE98_20470 [Tannerellaceae bacterium]|nr:hypothetical protein [Tannerellaceae bacterium]
MKIAEKYNKKLLVEGNDDQHVMWALCSKHTVAETFDVIDCGGIEKLKKQLPIRLKASETDVIGVVIDADDDLNRRWCELKSILVNSGFDAPETIPSTGAICKNEEEDKTVGIWIMPDNNVSGMLEDFIQFLIPEEDKLYPIVDTNLKDIEEKELHKYGDTYKTKARIHCWLALQKVPGTPLGASITQRYLSTEKDICQNLIGWLKRLFE